MRWFNHLVVILIFIFGLVGATTIATTIHEISHYNDFKQYVTPEGICVFNIPLNFSWDGMMEAPLGYFSYGGNYNETLVESIGTKSEFKSYTLSFIILILFLICSIIVMSKYWDGIYLRKLNVPTFEIKNHIFMNS